jgi:hypothetical protein
MTQPPYGDPAPPPDGPQHPPAQPYGGPPQDLPYAGQPAYPPPSPAGDFPAFPPPAPRKSRRGVLIGAVLAVVLILCAGGGVSAWLLLRSMESGEGAAEPATAVEEFLDAVYNAKDAARATELVCAEARDSDAITKKVNEVKAYDEKYDSPRFDWPEPTVDNQNEERAIVSVKLRMVTADEKTAEQDLKFTVVHKTGWWVCDVS